MQTDTINLLRECNAGIKMGESAIKQALPHARNKELRHTLEVCKSTHATLGDETLDNFEKLFKLINSKFTQ